MSKSLNIVRAKLIFETIKMLTHESEVIKHKIKIITMFEFGWFTKTAKMENSQTFILLKHLL